jgi:hypothetical protein
VLTVDSWVDLASLQAPNTEEDVLRRGFQFPASTASQSTEGRFSVGRLPLACNGDEERGKIVKRLLLCKLAIGRAYYAAEDFAKVAPTPDGYDSFYLEKEINNAANPNGSGNNAGAMEEYVVKDGAQVLPTFLVTVEFDPQQEQRSRQTLRCDNCEQAEAVVYCQADDANLCATCDATLHGTKLTQRHQRTPLEAGPQAISHCRTHGDKVVEFFCPTCSKPVCVHCKMVGHHSAGEAAKHKLITVQEAYRGVSESSRAADPLMAARKQAIKVQLANLTERAKQVDANCADVQGQLEELFKKATADLKAITRRKLNVLKGDVAELRRQELEIAALDDFLAYCASGGNATQFILDWAHHQRLRSEQHAFAFFRDAIDVLPDIRIHGHIQVHVDNGTSGNYNGSGTNNPSMLSGGGNAAAGEDSRPRYSPSPSRSALSRPSLSKRADFLLTDMPMQASMLSLSHHHNHHQMHGANQLPLGSKLDLHDKN